MLNQMALQGRLTRDPELRQTGSGVAVCSFTVAWSEKYKETEKQLFLDCTAWRGTGEMVSKYFSKGKEIIVEGELTTEKWTDKDGNNRASIKMTVSRVHFCGPKSEVSASSDSYDPPAYNSPAGADQFSDLSYDDGELPF